MVRTDRVGVAKCGTHNDASRRRGQLAISAEKLANLSNGLRLLSVMAKESVGLVPGAFLIVLLVVLVRLDGGGTGVNTNGQYHSDWIGEAGQMHTCTLRLKYENLVAEVYNLNL
jgi:hypothetical protein